MGRCDAECWMDTPTSPSDLMIPSVSTIGTPRRMGLFWCRNRSFMGLAIRYFTRPHCWQLWRFAPWQHMGLVFEDHDGKRERHEALYAEGWHIKPWEGLVRFANREAGNRVEVIWLDWFDPARVAALWRESCSWEGRKSYDASHIIGLAIVNSLFGRVVLQRFGLTICNDSRMVFCSEGAARLVYAFFPAWDLRDTPDATWDSVTPASAYYRAKKLKAS